MARPSALPSFLTATPAANFESCQRAVLLSVKGELRFLSRSHGSPPGLEFRRDIVKGRGLSLLLRRALKHRIANPIVACLERFPSPLDITDFFILAELAFADKPSDIDLQTHN